jgi:hypothetical protein
LIGVGTAVPLSHCTGGCGLEGALGRVCATAWVEAGRSVSLAGEPTSRRTMAGAFWEHGKSASSDSGTGDGDTALCARAVSSALLCLQLQLTNGRRAELLLSDEQLPRVLGLLEQPA